MIPDISFLLWKIENIKTNKFFALFLTAHEKSCPTAENS